ncbi:hypothetical protein QN277_019135 [Acacia crassicarpa]|uniref:Reverse transcriptase Ty1/copia-type domain-containing protein n=1 Tax=Acacia crassicarpa TaxID=499986 RepID=A0AAE1JT76_9FABA|nr:hypothetical protein QN277_019135 [Acacia crassicarpa]
MPDSPASIDLPIALHKASLDSIIVPAKLYQALAHPRWYAAMKEEIMALNKASTWNLVDLPPGKKAIGCKWVFMVKTKADGTLERLKARLVAKGYAQTYGVDYLETFSPVAKLKLWKAWFPMSSRSWVWCTNSLP